MTVSHERPTPIPIEPDLPPPAVYPLENGDRLTRAEFERRYAAMPEVKKAELIEGKVYVASPVRAEHHGTPHAHVGWWLTHYSVFTSGTTPADNSTVRLDVDNEPQPDALLYVKAERGGQVHTGEDRYLEGAPELAVEVAASTASYDLYEKMSTFRRNGVREYIVWRVLDREIDWFVLRDERYQRLELGEDGVYRSEVFPGLWLDAAAMLGGDLQKVLAVLQQGIASEEHGAFVKRLAEHGQGAEGSSSNA